MSEIENGGAEDVVRIFDTTLRDGEQSPGASLTSAEKLEVAWQLARLGVDVLEAGFPAASPDDFAAVQQIARTVGVAGAERRRPPIITALGRATVEDIETTWRAVEPADRPRIHTLLSTSDIHMAKKLGMTRAQVLDRVEKMVTYARGLCPDVEFSPEDASRSDVDFLVEVLTIAIACGAGTLNITDTVGYATPVEYGNLMAHLRAVTPGADKVVWSVHCHDDLGMATANSLAGIAAGARQAEVTINGIGERAGNASLEELVMALATRSDHYRCRTGIDTRELTPTSHLVSRLTGLAVAPNKAIVGENAFSHESGIHQDGMLKDKRTYEIMTAATVGQDKTRLVLGKHSGRHGFKVRMAELGFPLEGAELAAAFSRFKDLADRKKYLTDADLTGLCGGAA
ncbi:MAG TPA: 2-isopropylmalate synthase [Acidobacteria bacterium]|nr:2-isopropylmalate synthase [Acidobacteriota bacterium]